MDCQVAILCVVFCTLLFKSPNNDDIIKDSGLKVPMVEPRIVEM